MTSVRTVSEFCTPRRDAGATVMFPLLTLAVFLPIVRAVAIASEHQLLCQKN